jgi:hypothetical protein
MKKPVTLEGFEYVKSELKKRKNKVAKVVTSTGYSRSTVDRIMKAETFESFRNDAKKRTEEIKTFRYRKLEKTSGEGVQKTLLVPEKPEEPKEESMLKGNVTQNVITAIMHLSKVIELQSQAIQRNTDAYIDLRDRMASANKMKALELFGKGKKPKAEKSL